MMKTIVCLFASIIALAIPSLCVCSFIFEWGDFAKAILVLATIFDVWLIGYAMNCVVDND